MIKLVLLIIQKSQSKDFYHDEVGKVYHLGSYGERLYNGEGTYNLLDRNLYRVDAANILSFGWKLLKNVENDNFILSPLSPQILLSCLMVEAKNTSASFKELKQHVGYENSIDLENLVNQMLGEKTSRELKIASAFFVKKDPQVKKTFYNPNGPDAEITANPSNLYHYYDCMHDSECEYYRKLHNGDFYERDSRKLQYPYPRPVDLQYVDFSKPNTVKETYKQWVETATNGVIKNAELEISSDTEMVLSSAIYFKSQWLFAFNESTTIDFKLSDGKTVPVEGMIIKKQYHAGTFSNIDAKWAAIPYNSTEALVIVVPNGSKTVDDILNLMNGSEMTEIIEDISGYASNAWLNVTIPKFKLTSKIDLKQPLEKMGIKKIFTTQSELYLYENGPALKIDAATQQSSMEIDEAGSIAASATAFTVVPLTIEREYQDSNFVVDRPFLAIIIDRKYGVPYFMAKISDPRRQS